MKGMVVLLWEYLNQSELQWDAIEFEFYVNKNLLASQVNIQIYQLGYICFHANIQIYQLGYIYFTIFLQNIFVLLLITSNICDRKNRKDIYGNHFL